LLSIIQQAIKDTFTQQVLDISVTELSVLYYNLIHHYCLSFIQPPTSISPSIYSTLQGFIPIPIINTITQTNTSTKIATQLTITLLSKISQNIHNQLWKPYCTKLANWKKTNNIQPQHTTYHSTSNQLSYTRTPYTYSCICGMPDQQHNDIDNRCPPVGLAIRKIEIWLDNWINFSTSTNSILHIQI
jgi:hypothetical protein